MKLEEALATKYRVELHWIDEEDGDGYWFAFLPDFGWSACSAMGYTMAEALQNLEGVKRMVMQYYIDIEERIPEPSTELVDLLMGRNQPKNDFSLDKFIEKLREDVAAQEQKLLDQVHGVAEVADEDE